jgi:hypothetical protein
LYWIHIEIKDIFYIEFAMDNSKGTEGSLQERL